VKFIQSVIIKSGKKRDYEFVTINTECKATIYIHIYRMFKNDESKIRGVVDNAENVKRTKILVPRL